MLRLAAALCMLVRVPVASQSSTWLLSPIEPWWHRGDQGWPHCHPSELQRSQGYYKYQYHGAVSQVIRSGRDGSANHVGSLEDNYSGSLLAISLP